MFRHVALRIALFGMATCLPCRAADWVFRETIIDAEPPQPDRITDVEIVDIDADGDLDILSAGGPTTSSCCTKAWNEKGLW